MTPTPGASQVCWRESGRPGPGTCARLSEVVLCRNCPEYTDAALRLLDRAAPADYIRHWTEHVAREPEPAVEGSVPVLVFRLGNEWLALPAGVVEEITEATAVHTLPHRSLPVQGVVSIRSELVVCVSLEALLELPPVSDGESATTSRISNRLVVLSGDGGRVAFRPSEVHGLLRYHPGQLQPPPATLTRTSGVQFTTGLITWKDRSVGCLDAGRVLSALTRSFS
jgi:chemotaxis-related protein WspD